MGAHTFVRTGYGKSAQAAYNGLVDDAIYEHGHDTYNGTISTTNGFSVHQLGQKTFTKAAIKRWIEKMKNATEKRECVCLELPRSHAKGSPRGYRAYLFVGWAAS